MRDRFVVAGESDSKLCRHGDIRAACLDCLTDPPEPPLPGFCWCGNRTDTGRLCGPCRARMTNANRAQVFREGKRTSDWVSTQPKNPPVRVPFVATLATPMERLSVCPGCGLEIYRGQTVVRVGGDEVWHLICR